MQRVYRLAVFAQFEVQLHALAVAVAHGGNALAAAHGLAFAHEQALVVAVGGEVGLVVLLKYRDKAFGKVQVMQTNGVCRSCFEY